MLVDVASCGENEAALVKLFCYQYDPLAKIIILVFPYFATQPQSTSQSEPVTKDAPSLAKK